MNESLNRSKLKYQYILIGLLALTMLPFIILHFYNHPTPEDFYFEEGAKNWGFIDAIRVYYKFWGGRYFTYIVACLNPLYFNSIFGFKIYGLALMLVFYYSLFLFISEFTKDSLKSIERILFSLSIFFVYMHTMPSIPEGIYWILSCIHYNIGLSLMMLFLVSYHRIGIQTASSKRNLYIFITIIIGFAIPGTVELSAATISIIILILLAINIFKDRKFNWPLLLIALVTFIGVYFVIKSPGNNQRSAQYTQDHQLFFSFTSSFTFLFQSILEWLFNSPLLIITVLFIPYYFKIIKSRFFVENIFTLKLYYPLVIFIIFLYMNSFVIVWSLGLLPNGRISDFIFFIFLIGWFLNMIILTYFLSKKYELKNITLPKYVYVISFILLAFFLIKDNNIKTAYSVLFDGSASEYNRVMYERYDYIMGSKSDSVEIQSIQDLPKTFFLQDVNVNPKSPYNIGYQSYFKKKYIYRKN